MGIKNVRRTLAGATALGAALALAGSGLASASTESATGTLDGDSGSSNYSEHTEYGMYGWDDCPFEELLEFNEDGTAVPGPLSCFTFVVREGTMQLGDIDVAMEPNSIMINGGMHLVERDWKPEAYESISSNPVTVPGGALGTESAEGFGPTAITAHVEQAGQIYFNNDLADMSLNLPIKLKLSNPVLGDNCYIGTDDDPIDITLQVDEETMFNEFPWTGDDGESYLGASYPNIEASDTDFEVPGASGCGLLGLGELNGLVNFRAGLPSEGGNNSIWTRTSYYAVPAWQVWNENIQE